MDARENLLRACRRQGPAWVPYEFTLCPALEEEFQRRTGRTDYREYYAMGFHGVGPSATRVRTDFRRFFRRPLQPADTFDEWGVGARRGSVAHFSEMLHPMQDFTRVEEVADYPFPDLTADYRWAGVAAAVDALHARGQAAVAHMECTIFEISWYLRGMEEFLADLLAAPEMACAVMDRVLELRLGCAERFAAAGADLLRLGDDVSTQLDMMLSPALWRTHLKPRLAEVIAAAKRVKPDIIVFYHGDGNLRRIIPDLIEIGVDVLNPVQPECMDPVEIKRLYGDRLSFWGTVGTQTTMPFGTPDQVREVCRRMIGAVGAGGGLVMAPTHVLEPEVPWANVEAFVEACREYGRYV